MCRSIYVSCLLFHLLGVISTLHAASIPVPPPGNFYQGFYYSKNSDTEHDATPQDLAAYENAVGAKTAWVFFSDNWYETRLFPAKNCAWIHEAGKIPYIRLMLRSSPGQNRAEKTFILDAIAAGTFDADLKQWAAGAKQFGAPLLVEWGTECNGDWFAWNGKWNGHEMGAGKFIAAWRHIVTLVREAGCSNITWVWHVDSEDSPKKEWNRLENYYPGDDFVDWIAVSAYGPQTPKEKDAPSRIRELLDPVYPRINALAPSKPLILAEFGCTRGNPQITAPDWARDALADLFSDRWPRISGFCWWNEAWQNDDNPKHDTDMVVMHDPVLAKVFRDQFTTAKDKIQQKPVPAAK
jgi:Glycosyl hydrolase family 26